MKALAIHTKNGMKQAKYSWLGQGSVQRLLAHYEPQWDEEVVADDEAAYESTTHTMMEVPIDWSQAFGVIGSASGVPGCPWSRALNPGAGV